MVSQLTSCSLEIPEAAQRAKLVARLRSGERGPLLVLDTCQRLEVYGWTPPSDQDMQCASVVELAHARQALRRLARIAAGLESRIIGELEILGQVREAYRDFTSRYGKQDTRLDRLFQDALALARKARRESGVDRTLTGLGALTARTVMESLASNAPVAIVGSGSLAKSVARYLGKRSQLPVRVSSRCPEHAMQLAAEIGGFHGGLDELAPMLADAEAVISATAAPHPLIYSHHLPELPDGKTRLVLDLGEPSDCAPCVQGRADLRYIGLIEIETLAQANTADRMQRGDKAAAIIDAAAASYRL